MQVCSICSNPFFEFGNNAQPINNGRCCNICNDTKVIPARLKTMREHLMKEKEDESRTAGSPPRPVGE